MGQLGERYDPHDGILAMHQHYMPAGFDKVCCRHERSLSTNGTGACGLIVAAFWAFFRLAGGRESPERACGVTRSFHAHGALRAQEGPVASLYVGSREGEQNGEKKTGCPASHLTSESSIQEPLQQTTWGAKTNA